MQKVFDSEVTIIVNSGFLYFPLSFDPSIEHEVGPTHPAESLIRFNGNLFVKSLSLRSLSESYPELFPDAYERLKKACFDRCLYFPEHVEMTIDSKLEIILFHILPRFIRRNGRLRRGKPGTEEILDLISETVAIPEEFHKRADKFLNHGDLESNVERLGGTNAGRILSDGPVSGSELHEWLQQVLTARILKEEKERLNALIQERNRFIEVHRRYIATLLFMKERGFFEKDGAGFFRDGKSRDYVIYKRTGEYALKDYYARFYLFPDCRVAVRTYGQLMPVVLEKYKHPFLKRYAPNQHICVGESNGPPVEFSAENAIKTIEEGINALFYGYNSRRRNGHHSLDRNTTYFRVVDFDDYRIPADHPKILSGEVEVKNIFK